MGKAFSPSQLETFLKNQNFKPNKQDGTSHVKWSTPGSLKIPKGMRPFVIVIEGRKQYDPVTSDRYRTQLRQLGLSNEEIKKALG